MANQTESFKLDIGLKRNVEVSVMAEDESVIVGINCAGELTLSRHPRAEKHSLRKASMFSFSRPKEAGEKYRLKEYAYFRPSGDVLTSVSIHVRETRIGVYQVSFNVYTRNPSPFANFTDTQYLGSKIIVVAAK